MICRRVYRENDGVHYFLALTTVNVFASVFLRYFFCVYLEYRHFLRHVPKGAAKLLIFYAGLNCLSRSLVLLSSGKLILVNLSTCKFSVFILSQMSAALSSVSTAGFSTARFASGVEKQWGSLRHPGATLPLLCVVSVGLDSSMASPAPYCEDLNSCSQGLCPLALTLVSRPHLSSWHVR